MEKEQKALKKMVASGVKFDVVITRATSGLIADDEYHVIFITEARAEFMWSLQQRVDRHGGVRVFKSIDNAVKQIRAIGYRRDIIVRD